MSSYAARATRFLAERRGLATLPNPCPEPGSGGEISEISEERPTAEGAVWWPDPSITPPRPGLDDWDRQTRASFGPILHLPPRGCLGPRLCSRIGRCERSRSGLPCRTDE